jgi:hypothetical protein
LARLPQTIDATKLFERYWDDRVFRDQASWAATGAPRDNDLTATAMDIAHQMLKERGVA